MRSHCPSTYLSINIIDISSSKLKAIILFFFSPVTHLPLLGVAGRTLPAIVKKSIYKSKDSVKLLTGTFGSSYTDTNAEKQEEDTETHKEQGHQQDEEL